MPDLKQNIVLVYEPTEEKLSDKSEAIESLHIISNWVIIKYKNSNKEYRYNSRNVFVRKLETSIEPALYDVFIGGELKAGVAAIGNYGSHYGLIYKGKHVPEYIAAAQVRIRRSTEKSILAYLSEIAAHSIDEEQVSDNRTEKQSFLSSQLHRIIHTEGTVLSDYLNKNPIRIHTEPKTLLYPFDVNTSQKEAVKKALGHNISIIQGPPGTGKTQSILNLIANLVNQGKSVGIVSNNNSAIENVKYKLDNAGYGFLIAHLGNNENKRRFFETSQQMYEPDVTWNQNQEIIESDIRQINQIDTQINTLLQQQEELARYRESLSCTKHEKELFDTAFGTHELPAKYNELYKWDGRKLIAFKMVINYFPLNIPFSKIFLCLSLIFKYGLMFLRARKIHGTALCLALDRLIYDKKIEETEMRIRELEETLNKSNLQELLHTYSELSTIVFRHSLYRRYSQQQEQGFTMDNYHSRFTEFIARFPVILSTTHSILNSVSQPLDYIIIDESSQVDILTASLAFSACRNAVIVGDEQQLPHIVGDTVKEIANELLERFHISTEYDYVNKNIITSLHDIYGDSVPQTLLREHYRCNPLIIGFCNRKYYQGQLIMMKGEPAAEYNESNYPVRIFRTVEGLHGHDKINERQIAVIQNEVLPQCQSLPRNEIGIISPYRNQANEITRLICKDSGIESDTIHKFQGREKREIIFSTVSNQITEFMDKAELINVAVSRAIDQFIMVMPHSYELTPGSNIGDLIRYIEYQNPYGTAESRVISYFDLLQPIHSPRLDNFRKKIQGHSRFKSENIIETAILHILNEEPLYSGFDLRRGYPLYLMTPNKADLSQREIEFANNRLTHVDFLIVNRCDNSFVLAIEVDGYTYHSQSRQQERDAIKNKILAQNGIALLRLSTRGDSEGEKIREKLRTITASHKRD